MKKNKKILFVPAIIILLIIGVIIFFFLKKEETYTLSTTEKKYIDDNKNKVIDVSVINNLPILGLSGDGLFFSFFDFFESNTNLELNKQSYNLPEKPFNSEVSFKVIEENDDLTRNNFLFFEDNFSIISKQNKKISDLDNLVGSKIGVISGDLSSISNYIETNQSLNYIPFEEESNMFLEFKNEELDYIIVPKTRYLDLIIKENYYISYNLSALSKKYVFSVDSKNKTINSIFEKKYKEWHSKKFEKEYIEKMNEFYFNLSEISEKEKTAFKSREYIYGYVENLPYDTNRNNTLYGLNSEFLKGFESFSGAKFQYKKFNTVLDLEKAINKGNIDLAFNYHSFKGLSGINNTIEVYSKNYVILSHVTNNVTIDSFSSLKGKEIYTIKDTLLAKYINDNSGATVKAYTKVNSLTKNKEPLIILDISMYNYYKNSILKDYYIAYEDKADLNYSFIVKRDDTNNIFTEVFQYYLANINHTEFKNRGMYNLITTKHFTTLSYIYYALILTLFVILIIIVKKKRELSKIKKVEKIKYIDPLTSLKNRTYLADKMNEWDENSIYPKAIVIVDLNNLKDVNSNHGYDKGDKLIKQAANILVNNQPEKTDIIRSDGNEFIIYMVGYTESQVIAYMRKIYKLMKSLEYEYGATLGYSMILDDVKLIEDAINEAVLDMITNKELKSND